MSRNNLVAAIATDLGFGSIILGLSISIAQFTPVAAALEGFGLGLIVGIHAHMPKKPRLIGHILFVVVGGGMFFLGVVPLLGVILAMIGVGHLVSMLI